MSSITRERPSLDQWLKEAKAEETAGQCGMYLVHNGTVRETAMNAEKGSAYDPAKVNLAELERRSSITRAKLRRLKENGFVSPSTTARGKRRNTPSSATTQKRWMTCSEAVFSIRPSAWNAFVRKDTREALPF